MKLMLMVLALLGAGCEPRAHHVAPAPVAPAAPAEWETRRVILKARWAVEDAAARAELDARWARHEAALAEAWSTAPSEGGKDQ